MGYNRHKKTLMNTQKQLPLIILIVLLILKWGGMAIFIALGPIHLGPDEAQYWTWSQALDWGYYSKPPGIAWEIWLGTFLLGDSELGVRLGPLFISAFLSLAVYGLAKVCKLTSWQSLGAALIMTLTPLGILSSLFATTDAPFSLFWTLACIPLAYAIQKEEEPHYFLVGFLILCGALFKWPIYYLWLLIFIFMPIFPHLKSKKILFGFAISLLGLIPSVIWNAQRGWPTFKHVWMTNITGGLQETPKHMGLFHGNPLEFLGAQAGLVSPILFILLVISLVSLFLQWRNIPNGIKFCGLVCVSIITSNVLMSLFQHMQGNWMVYAYPTGFVFLSWFLSEKSWGKLWLSLGLGTSVILTLFVMSLPTIQQNKIFKDYPIPFALNPYRECLGWDRLSEILQNVQYKPEKDFLFADRYQDTSILSFYGPSQKRAYFLNLRGIRKNQFSFWPGMNVEQKGNTGYFVLSAAGGQAVERLEKSSLFYKEQLANYFNEVTQEGIFSLFEAYDKPVKACLIFRCKGYNGKIPPETSLF